MQYLLYLSTNLATSAYGPMTRNSVDEQYCRFLDVVNSRWVRLLLMTFLSESHRAKKKAQIPGKIL